ncbi:MAG: Gfo/Idh/MocA family oxidoreductase [Candidatus Hydrogenedentes bacterium]|nr:Gfo/Idh/MocA family oxidoreductase [Candidatus Hydrogenedentota bacterium]
MNVAIVGCSAMGRLHAAVVARCGLNIVACADADERAAKALAKTYDAVGTADMLQVIRRPDVDIVVIATPTPTHEEYVIAAAKEGKHIFCEKPFCLDLAACKRALSAVKRAKVKLFVGHVVRYFHEFERLRAEIAAGSIGQAGWAKLYRGGLFPGVPGSWFRDYTQSGGVTLDCMIHDLDWARYVFGEPDHIYCQALRRSEPEPIDYSQVTMRMKSGVIVTLIGTWAHPAGFRVKVEVCGSDGMLQYDSAETPVNAQQRQVRGAGPTMIVPASPVDKSPYQLEWEDFLAWIEDRQDPRVDAQDAVRAVEMALAALKSADTGRPVKL